MFAMAQEIHSFGRAMKALKFSKDIEKVLHLDTSENGHGCEKGPEYVEKKHSMFRMLWGGHRC